MSSFSFIDLEASGCHGDTLSTEQGPAHDADDQSKINVSNLVPQVFEKTGFSELMITKEEKEDDESAFHQGYAATIVAKKDETIISSVAKDLNKSSESDVKPLTFRTEQKSKNGMIAYP